MLEDSTGEFKTKYGENAGKIWAALNEKAPLRKQDLLEITQLNDSDFHIGVGWLAREDKILEDSEGCYKLDNTNLTSIIGANAGRIWKIMDIWGEVEFSTIKRLTDVDDEEVYSALGWLAKEDKICVDEKQRYTLK